MRIRAFRGYTLIELAIALALLGLVAVLLWRFGSVASQRIAETEAPQILEEANQALIGYAMANHRLPCPDTSANGDGFEHCGGATTGRLPVVALGLARADMQNIRYGVYRNTVSTLVNGASTTVRIDVDYAGDRFPPLVTKSTVVKDKADGYYGMNYYDGSASASETLLGRTNGIDFCHALRLAGKTPANTTSLNIVDAGGTSLKNVAYALALPGARDANGDSNMFDGANTGGVTFAAPAQPVSANYDDVVQAIDFGQLFDRMSCAGALSAADHAHFNAATAAAMMHANFVNYDSQLLLTAELAYANYLMATAAAVHAGGDVSGAAAAMLFAVAASMIPDPAGAASIPLAGLAIGASAVGLGLAIPGAVTAQDAWQGALQTKTDFQPLLNESAALEISILENAKVADAAGLY